MFEIFPYRSHCIEETLKFFLQDHQTSSVGFTLNLCMSNNFWIDWYERQIGVPTVRHNILNLPLQQGTPGTLPDKSRKQKKLRRRSLLWSRPTKIWPNGNQQRCLATISKHSRLPLTKIYHGKGSCSSRPFTAYKNALPPTMNLSPLQNTKHHNHPTTTHIKSDIDHFAVLSSFVQDVQS